MELLCELPNADPILEDEIQFVKNCPTYDHIRNNLSSDLLTKINNDEYSEIFESTHSRKHIFKKTHFIFNTIYINYTNYIYIYIYCHYIPNYNIMDHTASIESVIHILYTDNRL